MPEKRKFSIAEVKGTIAASLTAAFGFVIALVWNNVVMGAVGVAGIKLTPEGGAVGVLVLAGTAIFITVVMVFLIIFMGRWGSKQ